MFLIKCNCGCFFTVRNAKPDKPLICQNCGEKNHIYAFHDSSMNQGTIAYEEPCAFSVIPDNAKVTVTFDT